MDQTVFKKYSETFGARFTKRQKNNFQAALIEDFKELGYDHQIVKGRRLLSRANNLVFGNIKHVKHVIAVPYDTPQKVFWPKSYYFPMDGMATSNKNLLPVFGPVLFLYLILLAFMYGFEGFGTDVPSIKFAMTVIILLVILLFYLMLHGITNKKNYNRNSAGIVAALEIAKTLSKDQKRTTVFLFLDANKTRHLGASVAAEDFLKQSKNPTIIVLNTFAHGSTMQIGYNPQNKKLAQELNKVFPNSKRLKTVELTNEMRNSSPMEHFAKAVTIGAGELDKKGRLCVMGTGTNKDCVVDEEHMDHVIHMVSEFLKK